MVQENDRLAVGRAHVDCQRCTIFHSVINCLQYTLITHSKQNSNKENGRKMKTVMPSSPNIVNSNFYHNCVMVLIIDPIMSDSIQRGE